MLTPPDIPNIEVEDIDHLGIIAGIIDDIGLVELINEQLGEHPQENVSAGHVVKALILNCMGFLSAPLYLFSQFFVGKATEHLLGCGIKAKYLNARRIGRVLDQLYTYGVSTLFMSIAVKVVKTFGVSLESVHGDSSSFCVHGEYDTDESQSPIEPESVDGDLANDSLKPQSEYTPIAIKRGYSRDHRFDLKQFTLNLITSTDGDIPLGLRVGNGNEVDTDVLVPFMKQWHHSWQTLEAQSPTVMAADAALFTEENLGILGAVPWISRVPASIGEAKRLMRTLPREQFQDAQSSRLKDYCFTPVCSSYGDIHQRWIIVESQPRCDADLKSLDKKLQQHTKRQHKALNTLAKQEFACEADANKAARVFEKKLDWHVLEDLTIESKPHHQKRGRPGKDDVPSHYSFHVKTMLKNDPKVLEAQRIQLVPVKHNRQTQEHHT